MVDLIRIKKKDKNICLDVLSDFCSTLLGTTRKRTKSKYEIVGKAEIIVEAKGEKSVFKTYDDIDALCEYFNSLESDIEEIVLRIDYSGEFPYAFKYRNHAKDDFTWGQQGLYDYCNNIKDEYDIGYIQLLDYDKYSVRYTIYAIKDGVSNIRQLLTDNFSEEFMQGRYEGWGDSMVVRFEPENSPQFVERIESLNLDEIDVEDGEGVFIPAQDFDNLSELLECVSVLNGIADECPDDDMKVCSPSNYLDEDDKANMQNNWIFGGTCWVNVEQMAVIFVDNDKKNFYVKGLKI
jgi:hypothetical protein